jgi:regulation of enolase protein 1 (concanavalin A-like superfamily)
MGVVRKSAPPPSCFLEMAAEHPAKKARTDENGEGKFSLNFDFCVSSSLDPSLTWLNPPLSATFEGESGLKVVPKPDSDFWCKLFRDPPANRSSGHALLYTLPDKTRQCVFKTDFSIEDYARYDQAGVMVYVDDRHWLKAGLEMENDVPNMSAVVTNMESDWNLFVWPTKAAQVRVTLKRYSSLCECSVEFMEEGGAWSVFRDAYINLQSDEVPIKVGLLCAAPKKENDNDGLVAFFKSLTIEGE